MKKYFATGIKKIAMLAIVLSIVTGTSAFAKTEKAGYRLKQNFAAQFKDASDVNWKAAGLYNKATFVMNNEKASVFYDHNTDEFIGISKEVLLEDLPQPAARALLTKYKEYTIGTIIKFTDADAAVTYFTELQKDDKTIIVKADEAGRTAIQPENSRL